MIYDLKSTPGINEAQTEKEHKEVGHKVAMRLFQLLIVRWVASKRYQRDSILVDLLDDKVGLRNQES